MSEYRETDTSDAHWRPMETMGVGFAEPVAGYAASVVVPDTTDSAFAKLE